MKKDVSKMEQHFQQYWQGDMLVDYVLIIDVRVNFLIYYILAFKLYDICCSGV